MDIVRRRLALSPRAPGSDASNAQLREWLAGKLRLEY
jgi:hypothetical protein